MPTSLPHRPVKRLGQNFLANKGIAERVVSTAELSKKDTVLEPGSGYGALTHLLEISAGRVIAVEMDRRLADHLRREFKDSDTVSVIEGDVLDVPLPDFNKVVGTPPYNLSSKLVLFLTRMKFDRAVLVFQKEFGERLLAPPGTSEYGRISVTAQRALWIRPIMSIPAKAFEPTPKVDSILLEISPKRVEENGIDEGFEELVRGLFNQRRRVVKGALLHYLSKTIGKERARNALARISLPEKRVYQLTIPDFEEIAHQIASVC